MTAHTTRVLLAAAGVASWAAWLGWDRTYPQVREAAFPFDIWQIVGCGACVGVLVVLGWVTVGPRPSMTAVGGALVASCAISCVLPGEVAVGFWILAAVLVACAAGVALVVVGRLALVGAVLVRGGPRGD